VVLGAHHDSAPDAPAAYDAGGGVGVLIESARVLARARDRPRTLVFVSWDGEEAWSTGRTTTAGSRAFVKGLGPRARDLVAAFVIEMCGWRGGTPVLHPIAYVDPLRPGGYVVTPAWLMKAALQGGAGLRVGDPLIPWLYQPAVRTFKGGLYGDDLSFLQAGLPAVFTSDSSFSAYYPWYHQPADTPDKLDADALARMGRLVLGVVDALGRVPRGGGPERQWFAAFGAVAGAAVLWALGAVGVAASLVPAVRAGGTLLGVRLAQAAAIAFLVWRHPVPALWVFLPLLLLTAWRPRGWPRLVGLVPLLALAGLGVAAWARGYLRGTWLTPVDLVVAGLAVGLFWAPIGGPPGTRPRRTPPAPRRKAGRRR
jgi:hypothetical protein